MKYLIKFSVASFLALSGYTSLSLAENKATLSTPSADLTSLTQFMDFEFSNVMTGFLGNYHFQQGFNKEKRSGLINRQHFDKPEGCILPSLEPNQVVYLEVDTTKYEALGNSNDWEMQCVKSDNLSEGAVNEKEPKGEYPYKVDYLSGKDLMLHCGNDQNVSECAEGSNRKRSTAWSNALKERNKSMISVMGVTSTLAPKSGEKLYCQYYNKKAGKSLFAFEYLRTQR